MGFRQPAFVGATTRNYKHFSGETEKGTFYFSLGVTLRAGTAVFDAPRRCLEMRQ